MGTAVAHLSKLWTHAVCGISSKSNAPNSAALQLLVTIPGAMVVKNVLSNAKKRHACFRVLLERTAHMTGRSDCGTALQTAPCLARPALSVFVSWSHSSMKRDSFEKENLPERLARATRRCFVHGNWRQDAQEATRKMQCGALTGLAQGRLALRPPETRRVVGLPVCRKRPHKGEEYHELSVIVALLQLVLPKRLVRVITHLCPGV